MGRTIKRGRGLGIQLPYDPDILLGPIVPEIPDAGVPNFSDTVTRKAPGFPWWILLAVAAGVIVTKKA